VHEIHLHLRYAATLIAVWSLFSLSSKPLHAAEPDPTVIAQLAALKSGQSLVLPPFQVEAKGLSFHGIDQYGPGQRDYCNKMAYAPDRRAALYAGGNHQVPHRMNDVWEFRLGANCWRLLYEPDGGNPAKHKSAYLLTSRTLVRDPETALTQKQRDQIAAYGVWWKENVAFENGHVATKRGGPIMPAHTWDAFCYDEQSRQILWGMGANPGGQLSTWAYYADKPVAEFQKQVDETYTPMWTFDPKTKRWNHYRTDKPRAALRGMGASMTYLPDFKRTLWYVSAQNVSPGAFEMWQYDSKADVWAELKPNGGQSIASLSLEQKIAPTSEQQMAYSPKHGKLVAVKGYDTFVYDVVANAWSKANTDERIWGHDARSVFAYDSKSDRFLLAFPPHGKGKDLKLAAFSIDTNKWELIEPEGGLPISGRYGGHFGYYDPEFDVFVVQARGRKQAWVYRD